MKSILFSTLIILFVGCGGEEEIQGSSNNRGKDRPTILSGLNDYQIGSEWNRKKLTRQSLRSEDWIVKKTASATAKIRTMFNLGTSIYLGKHNGNYLMATNKHVFTGIPFCLAGSRLAVSVFFPLEGKTFQCKSVVGSWRNLDLIIFNIEVPSGQEWFFEYMTPLKFNFKADIEKGTPLLTMGFGSHKNPSTKLTMNSDKDCKVYSETNKFKKLVDPVTNSQALKTWSFATGCDVSHGDSGAAVLDRESGDLIGLVWATANPKPVSLLSDTFMDTLFAENSESIWKDLTYVIPNSEIFKELSHWSRNSQVSKWKKAAIRSLLNLD